MLKYKNYKLVDPSEKVNNQINDLICNQNGSIFHEPRLNQIIEKKFFTKLCYLVDNPINIRHASIVHIIKNKFGFSRYNLRPLYDIPYSGFIGKKSVDFSLFSTGLNESISYVGFPYEKKIISNNESAIGQTTMVDLSLSEDDIFSNVIHSKRRNMIRKAIKNGIVIETYNKIEGLELFWPILKELHKRLSYNYLDFNYYKIILETYFPNQKAFIMIAFKNQEPISGVLILGNENYMHYYKGASTFGVKNEGQGELLQWEAIKYARNLGAKYYDLCNLNKEKLPDIYRFKTGIANNIFEYPVYTKNSIGYKVSNRLSEYI